MELEIKRLEEERKRYLGDNNQPSEQLDLCEQEKEERERKRKNRIYEIERKEEVYGLGILIMEILLGIDFTIDHIKNIYEVNGRCSVVSIPDKLKKDKEIAEIVEDCLLNVECRPTIQEILRRLERWLNTDTPEDKQVEYIY